MLNSGKRWTAYGHNKLIYMAIGGASDKEIARGLARTPKAIERYKHRMKYAIVHAVPFGKMMDSMLLYARVSRGELSVVNNTNTDI